MAIDDILSIQLYSLRFLNDREKELDAVQAAGIKLVEAVQGHLDDAAGFKAKLDARGLQAPSCHVSMEALESRLDWIVEGARTVGFTHLYMPAVPNEQRVQDAAGWQRTGAALAVAADKLGKEGLSLGYHNHDWELKALDDGRIPLEVLFEAAPDLGWQADVAWLARGGADPLNWLDRYKDRLTAIHVKDIAPAGQNLDEDGWCDVGSGTMNWSRLWGQCLQYPVALMVLEHDKPKDGARFAKASADFLRTL